VQFIRKNTQGVEMKAVGLLCALAAPLSVSAADNVGHYYLTPNVGGISVDNDRPLQDKDWLYGLGIGKHISNALSLELNLNRAQIDGIAGGNITLTGLSLDLLGVMNRSGMVSPYVSIGAGAVQNDRGPGLNANDAMAQAGVGLLINLWEGANGANSFALRPDVKARWSEAGAEGTLRDYIGTIGFQYSFGEPRAAEPMPAPAPTPAPAPAPAPPPPPEPVDTDRDGVTDQLDRCPDTPAGVAVDAYGCTRQGSITLEGVGFEVDSAQLTTDSRDVLSSLAADLKKYPRLKIELQGHTDSSGADQYNLQLSQKRADAVRDYLLAQGVASSQLTSKGYGETQPIEDNSTAEGRTANRRVVMSVVDNPADVKVEGEAQ
jgi:OmpA-OmpF porin, OOP family